MALLTSPPLWTFSVDVCLIATAKRWSGQWGAISTRQYSQLTTFTFWCLHRVIMSGPISFEMFWCHACENTASETDPLWCHKELCYVFQVNANASSQVHHCLHCFSQCLPVNSAEMRSVCKKMSPLWHHTEALCSYRSMQPPKHQEPNISFSQFLQQSEG